MPDQALPAPDPVGAAFAALANALAERALFNDFDRAVAYRRRVLDLSERWGRGELPFTPRGRRAAGSAEEA